MSEAAFSQMAPSSVFYSPWDWHKPRTSLAKHDYIYTGSTVCTLNINFDTFNNKVKLKT
jgi:hypothetical protein